MADDRNEGKLPPITGPEIGEASSTPDRAPEVEGYEVTGKLGQGGMGTVWSAVQLTTRRQVALKVFGRGAFTSEKDHARFEREVELTARLQHPNIARLYESNLRRGVHYYAMELIHGKHLDQYVEEHRLTQRQILELMATVCQAVQHAHERGVIHRDLKPSNILVSEDGQPHVLDFGLGKGYGDGDSALPISTYGEAAGTPPYMSPEQARGHVDAIDTRTDVYALGVILFRLLTGQSPHDLSGTRYEVLRRIAERDVKRPREITRAIDRELEALLLKALAHDPKERYGNAESLRQDIENYLTGEPLAARRPTTVYFLLKRIKKYRAPVAVASAVLVALISIAVFAYLRIARERTRAIIAEEERTRQWRRAEAQAYASDMNLALQALTTYNMGRARELLNRHRPRPGEPDLRGWEWRYLWQQCPNDALFTLCQRPYPIWSLAVSADGRWLAVGEDGRGGLSVWDLATRQEVTTLAAGDAGVRVAFSPRDALLAFSAETRSSPSDVEHTVRLWNGANEQVVAEVSTGGWCMGLAFSGDGETLITYAAGPANEVALWRVPGGDKVISYPVSPFHENAGTAGTPFAVARDKSVVAVAPDNTIHLIDLKTGKELWTKEAADGAGEWVKALALSPDAKIVASGTGFEASEIRLWDAVTGDEIARLPAHRAWVPALLFWPDGKTLASAGADQVIGVWDLTDTSKVPQPHTLFGHKLEVWRLALLPDGKTLVSGCKDGSVCLWDTATIKRGYVGTMVTSVAAWGFAADGRSVVILDFNRHVQQRTGRLFGEGQLLIDLRSEFDFSLLTSRTLVRISRDGRWMAAGLDDGTIKVWDLQARTLRGQVTVATGKAVPFGFVGQGEESLVFGGRNDATVREWDLSTWQEKRSWQVPADTSVFISKDGRWSLAIDGDGNTLRRDTATGRETSERLDIKAVNDVAFTPAGNLFAAASDLGYVKLWETATLRELAAFPGFLMSAHSVAFSPDGKRLAAGGDGSEGVKLWDTESYQELLTLEGEGSHLRHPAFSPDGNVLGFLNSRGELSLWVVPSWAEIEAAEKRLETVNSRLKP